MDVYAEARGIKRRRALGEKSADQAGQHVTTASCRERGVGERCDSGLTARGGNHRPRPFQHYDLAEFPGGRQRARESLVIGSSDRRPREPLEFARVRCQNRHTPAD